MERETLSEGYEGGCEGGVERERHYLKATRLGMRLVWKLQAR